MLTFINWLESKKNLSVHPEVMKWISSAEELKKDLEKLKAVLKDKKPEDKKVIDDIEKEIDDEEKPEVKKPEVKKPGSSKKVKNDVDRR